ncbi:hypothetical protein CPQG_00068 [Cyanophage P-RSM3]|jgi:hypothetical protein|uniref:Uncharacterized protein n=3 Tax=Ronodorvirus ssm4 TaxID=2845939 RepID=M1Q688_9CAUD|nr:Phd-like antitoxin [Prochlorococcus phage P-SSM4]AAX46824.1 hypothetical protein PSSM4_023 [Prochlorococcus phage P-SSM4]AGF91363.1 hypothetical protein CPYG_00068 [Cyanophage P-SS1]AGH26597.1 hypothetical protein CPQG_00068 [Cyanophage P-RSM3]|tara:strand:- start:158 stop:421 length:264 start_codon:yes stop_codon:yes gene_type:complete
MTDIQDITAEEAVANLPFLLSLTERNRTVWRIKSPNGSVALLSPVIQSGPPVDKEVINQVEEFRNKFLNDESSQLATPLEERTEEAS